MKKVFDVITAAQAVCSLMLALACGPALADPGGDAPETFAEAVLISPGSYSASYELPADIDYYKFRVEQGQDIAIVCFQTYHSPHPPGGIVPGTAENYPCTARLLDPNGTVRDSPSQALSFRGAEAGEWRLEVDGADLHAYDRTHDALVYYFTVSLSGGDSESGGSLAGLTSLLLGGLAFLRGAGRRKAAVGSLTAALALSACGSGSGDSGGTTIPDNPGAGASVHRPPADDLPETGLQGQVPLADQLSGRSAQGYRRGTHLVSANDIEGRGRNGQLAWLGDCAYVGAGDEVYSQDSHDPRLAVLDVADPSNPQLVRFIENSPVWAHPGFSIATNEPRRLLAGMVADGSVLEIYDASDCRNPILRSSLDLAGALGGSVGNALKISADGRTAYAALCCRISGAQDLIVPNSSRKNLAMIDITDPSNPVVTLTWAAAVTGGDDNADLFGIDLSADGTRAYVTLQGDHHVPNTPPQATATPSGLMILDISDIQRRALAPQIRVVSELTWIPNETFGMAYAPRLLRIKGRPYLLVTDMSYAGRSSDCPWTHARLVDISDERNPRIVSTIRLEVNDIAHCPQTQADGAVHSTYHSAVDNPDEATMAFLSWQSSGLRIFDIRDPSQPREIAYYNPPARAVLDPQTGQPIEKSDKYDQTLSSIRYDAATGHIWFASVNNGFQIVELTESAGD